MATKILISALPDISKAEMVFYDASFFRRSGPSLPTLPSPAAILQQHGDRECVVKFKELNLAVKIGHPDNLRLEEAQAIMAVRQAFPNNEVPVSEFMERHCEKHDRRFLVCEDLARIVALLKRVNQESSGRLIGSINGGTVQDCFFKYDYEGGPFTTISSFNDWFLAAATRQKPGPEGITGPYREYLPDTGNICFTHGDLTLGNIIVSGEHGSRRIAGIIDWEQAGWYPEYWKYCKLLYGVEYSHPWRDEGWAEKVMKPFEDDVFAEYASWRCP